MIKATFLSQYFFQKDNIQIYNKIEIKYFLYGTLFVPYSTWSIAAPCWRCDTDRKLGFTFTTNMVHGVSPHPVGEVTLFDKTKTKTGHSTLLVLQPQKHQKE
jgi:hypothetical protein